MSPLDSGAALRAGYVVWTTVSSSESGMSGEQTTPENQPDDREAGQWIRHPVLPPPLHAD